MEQMRKNRIAGKLMNIDNEMRDFRDSMWGSDIPLPPPPKRKEIKFDEASWIIATRDMYKIEINETTYLNGYGITRVPGGWIYDRPNGSVFVPFNNEGQENNELKL